MESATIAYETPLTERVTKVEVEVKGVSKDVDQINERLDRAARAAYFLGTAFIALAASILGTVIAN